MDNDSFIFTDNNDDVITYLYSSGTLLRNGQVLVSSLQSEPFTYLNIEQTITADSDSVKFIGISINVYNNGSTINMEEIIYARN